MYAIRCGFCFVIHTSEFFDEIEDAIMRCRDRAPAYKRGDLKDYVRENVTIRVDTDGQGEYRVAYI